MNILALETSTSACSVALQHGSKVYSRHEIAPMQHARLVLPMIEALLDESSLTLGQLDAIAYGCGPGSFTGIRIASSVAQGLGFAANVPIIQISSLAAMAQTAYQLYQWRRLLVAVDARMGQVYWAQYHTVNDDYVMLEGEERLITPGQDLISLEGADWYGVGDAWDKYAAQLVKPNTANTTLLPHAASVLTLAKIKFKEGQLITPKAAIPVYLR